MMIDFLGSFEQAVASVDAFVWGLPLIILLVGTGLWLTLVLRGLQFTQLKHSLYLALIQRKETDGATGDISHFQALTTALSATVGTGNIAGVATAIAVGGPGAMFWMWITGLVGMATKYAEALLAVKYREQDETGAMRGGPMYYIKNGLGWPWLGALFALFASMAAFGIGNMVQSNSVADAIHTSFHIPAAATGIVLMITVGLVVIGGIQTIGKVTSILVPIMIVFYFMGSLVVIALFAKSIPAAFVLIIQSAFTPTAASGGFIGASVMLAMRMGVARGVFSNESGLGSAPIAAAAAQTKHPVNQALVSMTQTFIDTLIVCTMTGLVIILTGAWSSGKNGAELTINAFQNALPGSQFIVIIGLILFAYSTILGWCYYGEKSIEYLLGKRAIAPYRIVFVAFVGIGSILKLELVWQLADIFNGLMAFPNLIALLLLTPIIVHESKIFFSQAKA